MKDLNSKIGTLNSSSSSGQNGPTKTSSASSFEAEQRDLREELSRQEKEFSEKIATLEKTGAESKGRFELEIAEVEREEKKIDQLIENAKKTLEEVTSNQRRGGDSGGAIGSSLEKIKREVKKEKEEMDRRVEKGEEDTKYLVQELERVRVLLGLFNYKITWF